MVFKPEFHQNNTEIKSLYRTALPNNSERVLLGLIMLYILVCYLVASAYGFSNFIHFDIYQHIGNKFIVSLLVLYLCCYAMYIMVAIKPEGLFNYFFVRLKQHLLDQGHLGFYLRAILIYFSFVLFFSAFGGMKEIIPGINPFSWDARFIELDKLLHFGVDPWRILQPVIGFPYVTAGINLFYNLWLFILLTILYWQIFTQQNLRTRMRFFYSFVLVIALNGTLFAILLSSAGPCFWQRLSGAVYYGDLMSYLSQVNKTIEIWAISTQDMLWQKVQDHQAMVGGGISAMPSVHVSTTLLFLLLALELKLKIWPAFAVFFIIILIGSVHLAWHYAVDGYVGIITTLLYWKLAGWLVNRLAISENGHPVRLH